MGRKLNYGNQVEPDIEPDQLSLMVSNMAELQEMEPADTPEEIETRLKFFFQWCSRKQIRPTVSLMCLCLGHPRQTLWKWQQQGSDRGKLIDRAKQVLEALVEQWMMTGKVNPVSGIFVMKAQFGFKDTLTIEPARPDPLMPTMTPEQIAQRLKEIDQRIPNYKLEETQEYQKRIAADIPLPEEE